MVKTECPWTGGNILAAVDVGNSDGEHRTLHPGIVSHGYDIAGLAKVRCTWSLRIRRRMLSAADPTFQLKETIEARYREQCRSFQSEYDISDERLHVLEGPARRSDSAGRQPAQRRCHGDWHRGRAPDSPVR